VTGAAEESPATRRTDDRTPWQHTTAVPWELIGG